MAKERTDEQVKAAEIKKLERLEAKKRVLAFVEANAEQLDTIAADILMFVGKARRARAPRSSINAALRTALLEAKDKGLSEMDVFKAFKIGRPEMSIKSRLFVQVEPKDRVWFQLFEGKDGAYGVYKVVATGPNPPKGWTGHVPADKEDL